MCVAGTLAATFYSVNQSDDYAHAVEIGVYGAGAWEYLMTSFKYMVSQYCDWAGNYFSMFVQCLLSPLNGSGLPQLREVMLVNAVLFFVSFLGVLYHFLSKVFSFDNHIKLATITIIMYALMNYKCYQEIFYWFSGAASYSFPLIVMYISMIIMMHGNAKSHGAGDISYENACVDYENACVDYENACADSVSGCHKSPSRSKGTCRIKDYGHVILAGVLGFTAVGGSLTMAGTGCFILLLVCLYTYLCDKKISFKYLCLFIVYVSGAIVNAIAPGNYVRAESGLNGAALIKAVANTLRAAYSEYYYFLHETNFVIVLVAVIIIGIIIFGSDAAETSDRGFGQEINVRNYTIVSAIGLLTPLVSIFPVVLGYDSSFLANRTQFIIDQGIIVSLVNAALLIGYYIARAIERAQVRLCVIILSIMVLCMLAQSNYSIKDHQAVKTLAVAVGGGYKAYYNDLKSLNEYFSEHDGDDVVITEDMMPQNPANFSYFYLEDGWVNDSISEYYGLNSLTLAD